MLCLMLHTLHQGSIMYCCVYFNPKAEYPELGNGFAMSLVSASVVGRIGEVALTS